MYFERNLTLLSLLLKGNHEAAAEHLRRGGSRLDDFIYFVERHSLQLLVFSLLHRSPARKCLPPKWINELKAQSVQQWVTQESLVRELFRLKTLLDAAGQEFILLKGPYLAARFFGGIDRRAFSDLDILVRREQVPAVAILLRRAGYIRKSTILINERLTARFTHAFDFTNSKVAVDLHWLLSANAAHELDYEAIWQLRQGFVLRNHDYFVLSDEYQVVFTLISIFKDVERGAVGLRQFVDLYYILDGLRRHLDWKVFFERRRREKILRISVNVLALFLDLFDCRDRFPEASMAVDREWGLVKTVSSEYRQALIEASPGSWKNKVWAAGLYDCSRLHVAVWWLVSLPFRLAVHDSGRFDRLKRRLHQARNRTLGQNA